METEINGVNSSSWKTVANSEHPKFFTVQEGLEAAGFGLFQIKLMLFLMFLHMSDATEMMLLSVISTPLECEWGLKPWQLALISTVIFAGMSASSPAWGAIGDLYGRKPMMIGSGLMTSYFGILAAFSPSYVWLLVIRVFVGIAIPGSYSSGMTLMEFLPIKFRSKISILFMISWAIGSCLETGLAALVLPSLGWRWLMALSSLPMLLSSIGIIFFVPESFRFCLISGKQTEAMLILQNIAKQNSRRLPPGTLKLINTEKVHRAKFSDLFAKEFLLTTILVNILCFCATFLFYGNILVTSQAIDQKYDPCKLSHEILDTNCGCTVVSSSQYVQQVINACGELIATFINIILLDLIGRRRSIGLEFLLSGFIIFLLQICIPDELRKALGFLIRGLTLGSITCVVFYISEVYPTSFRSVGIGFSGSFIRLGSMTTPFLAQVLPSYSFTLTYCIYGGIGILAALISLLLRIETKGQILKDYSH